jgi:hypothetical protein
MCGFVLYRSFPHGELNPLKEEDGIREQNGNIGGFNSP